MNSKTLLPLTVLFVVVFNLISGKTSVFTPVLNFNSTTVTTDVATGNCTFHAYLNIGPDSQPDSEVKLVDNLGNTFSVVDEAELSDGYYYYFNLSESASTYTFSYYLSGADSGVSVSSLVCSQTPIQVQSVDAIDEDTLSANPSTCTFSGSLTLLVPTGNEVPTGESLSLKSTHSLQATFGNGVSGTRNTVSYPFNVTFAPTSISSFSVLLGASVIANVTDVSFATFTCTSGSATFRSISVDSADQTMDFTDKCTFIFIVDYDLNGGEALSASDLSLSVDSGLQVRGFYQVNLNETTAIYTVIVTSTNTGTFNAQNTFVLKQGSTIVAGAGSSPSKTISPITCINDPTQTQTDSNLISSSSSLSIISLFSTLLISLIIFF